MNGIIRASAFVALWTGGCAFTAQHDFLGVVMLLLAPSPLFVSGTASGPVPSSLSRSHVIVLLGTFALLLVFPFLSVSPIPSAWRDVGRVAWLAFWGVAWVVGILLVLRQYNAASRTKSAGHGA